MLHRNRGGNTADLVSGSSGNIRTGQIGAAAAAGGDAELVFQIGQRRSTGSDAFFDLVVGNGIADADKHNRFPVCSGSNGFCALFLFDNTRKSTSGRNDSRVHLYLQVGMAMVSVRTAVLVA